MFTKVISIGSIGKGSGIALGANREPINVFVRSAGEIGFNILEYFMIAKGLDSSSQQPVNVHYITREKYQQNPETDKLWQKADATGKDFKSNSNYPWAQNIKGLSIIENSGNRMQGVLTGQKNILPINIHFEADGTENLKSVNEATQNNQPAIMIDTTGQVKYGNMKGYLKYGNLLSVGSAPAKETPEGMYMPHMLYGVNLGEGVPTADLMDASGLVKTNEAAITHTGSCTTHGGTVVLNALNKNIKGLEVLSGNLTSVHSRTPSDNLDQLDLNFGPQTTGFSKAAKLVLPNLKGINTIDALAVRGNVAGASFYPLTMTVKADEELTAEKIINIIKKEANGDMKEQLAVLSPEAIANHNKKSFAINSALGVKGLMHTAIIDPKMVSVTNNGNGTYQINMKVNWYDNVGGFTHALLAETSIVAQEKYNLAGNILPLGHVWDFSKAFSFFNSDTEQTNTMYGSLADRWEKVDGQIVEGQPASFINQ